MYVIFFPIMAVASMLFVLLTWIFAPWLALFANSAGNLPKWLSWFQTFDNTLDAGWNVQGNFGDYLKTGIAPTGLTLWWYRTLWLYRNPGYGFDYWLLGITFDSSQWTVRVNNARWWIATGPRGAFCVRSMASGVSLKLGWKAWAYWQSGAWAPSTFSWGPSRRTPICFTPW